MADPDDDARRLLASDLPLAEVALQLGHPTYRAFAAWCRRRFGASPSEIRAGEPQRGRPTSAGEPRDTMYQVRCTASERDRITAAVTALAAQRGVPHGQALADALLRGQLGANKRRSS